MARKACSTARHWLGRVFLQKPQKTRFKEFIYNAKQGKTIKFSGKQLILWLFGAQKKRLLSHLKKVHAPKLADPRTKSSDKLFGLHEAVAKKIVELVARGERKKQRLSRLYTGSRILSTASLMLSEGRPVSGENMAKVMDAQILHLESVRKHAKAQSSMEEANLADRLLRVLERARRHHEGKQPIRYSSFELQTQSSQLRGLAEAEAGSKTWQKILELEAEERKWFSSIDWDSGSN